MPTDRLDTDQFEHRLRGAIQHVNEGAKNLVEQSDQRRRYNGDPFGMANRIDFGRLLADDDGRFLFLARQIARAVPSLWGYVGVDFVSTASGPVVLEINPRLTTSFCGLRSALGINVGRLVLDLLQARLPDTSRDRPPGRSVALSMEVGSDG